jgi:flagellar hook-associated protein 3 FlgL
MRVTTAGQTQAIIARLQAGAQRLEQAQRRATTGLRVERLSDDPNAGAVVMQAAAGLRAAAQYGRNAQRASAALDAEDSALQQITDLLARARELGVAANSANVDAAGRATNADEVRALLGHAVLVANTRVGDEYLFGGLTNDGRAPFDADAPAFVVTDPPPAGAPAGTPAVPRFPDGTRLVEVGAGGQRLRGAHDGTSVFLGRNAAGQPDATTGVFAALRELEAAMRAPDAGGISAALGAVDAAFGGVQAHVGEVGARQNAAEVVTAGLAALDQSLTRHKAELSEVDAAEAFTEAVARQTAYQAAMLASSRVMGLSLADYLR